MPQVKDAARHRAACCLMALVVSVAVKLPRVSAGSVVRLKDKSEW